MIKNPAVGLACVCLFLAGCASHRHDDAQSVCQQGPSGQARHGMHGTFLSSVGKTVGGAMPMALNAIPGVGGVAGGLAGMGMQQAMGGFTGGPGHSLGQDDGFRQNGFDRHKPPTEDEEDAAQSQRNVKTIPCRPEEDDMPDLHAEDIHMEETR
ncbi:hypothetical protein FOH24_03900 [Acetobacter tropicalis]|uniref:Lipoprotein n=2 Tax=Acetobacter tropicalis TaxID=104102 RepID=A0A094ZRP3_9PROT|nr:hypothetical protein [Acetobacter tropicalis]KAA8383945.1 hypothetical protein FOH22_15660 [Acetobacter tropicalis]KAA8392275.1 hypothetical protein FOH24_03900 [Acetobacter tropicalis]KGB24856.1 hypothetical protein AtDm6_0978 [Acetobacter tropicalis]KXV46755.1 hypothetical protein AD944_12700 [Acetobacter tropicalis]MBC9010237.1 hypothetical protein [Acetobacter tropicalis]